ncbi:hypothetical protein MMC25_005705 [Agyrium rufum]|nr:hypothetical protein [Agyrium rufum]
MASDEPSRESLITLTKHGKISLITLNIPSKLNAVSQPLYYRLSCLLRDAAADPSTIITILTGKGRYFSAGADVSRPRASADKTPNPHDLREDILRHFVANNLDLTNAFYTHPKILIAALNGPAIGLSAALLGFSDFIYAHPATFILTPFASLGLVTEGGASIGFVQRMGISKANEALILGKRLSAEELKQVGFVNKIWSGSQDSSGKTDESDGFLKWVMSEVQNEFLNRGLNEESMLKMKALIRREERRVMDGQGVAEVLGGLERFVQGRPQEEFRKLASGEKRHKL